MDKAVRKVIDDGVERLEELGAKTKNVRYAYEYSIPAFIS